MIIITPAEKSNLEKRFGIKMEVMFEMNTNAHYEMLYVLFRDYHTNPLAYLSLDQMMNECADLGAPFYCPIVLNDLEVAE